MESLVKPSRLLVFSTFAQFRKNPTGVTVNNIQKSREAEKTTTSYESKGDDVSSEHPEKLKSRRRSSSRPKIRSVRFTSCCSTELPKTPRSRSVSATRIDKQTPSEQEVCSAFSTPRSQIDSSLHSRVNRIIEDFSDEDDSENDESRPNIFVLSTFADANRRASLK